MKIQKIERNKWLGIVTTVLGFFVLLTATSTFEYAGGIFLFVIGFALWWINR